MQPENQTQTFSYSVRKSQKAKRARISVSYESGVVVTVPFGLGETFAEKFIKQKFNWIIKSLKYFEKFKNHPVIKAGRRDYLKNRKAALELAKNKVSELNRFYGFSYNRVSTKNQKTRWGSCSKKGNLNFNYKIIYLQENLLNYLIVHELCHLKEMNHSKDFWHLVGKTIPDYKDLRKQLQNFVLI